MGDDTQADGPGLGLKRDFDAGNVLAHGHDLVTVEGNGPSGSIPVGASSILRIVLRTPSSVRNLLTSVPDGGWWRRRELNSSGEKNKFS